MTRQVQSSYTAIAFGAVLGTALCFSATFGFADTVTLRTADGGLEVEGRYLGHDSGHIRIETEAGRLTFSRAVITCTGDACPTAETPPFVRFSGATRLADIVLPALLDGFARDSGLTLDRENGDRSTRYTFVEPSGDPLAAFVFVPTTTADGLADLLADEADVLMSYRTLSDSEFELTQEAGLGSLSDPQQMHLLGLDAIVPVVSPRLGVTSLSLEQVAAAMAGEVTNWSVFGGPDIAISLHLPDLDHAVTRQFERDVLDVSDRSLSDAVQFHATTAAASDAIADDRAALGVLPLRAVGNALLLTLRDECGVAAVPTSPAVATADYPLTTAAVLYRARRILPPIYHEFEAWLGSSSAQAILRRAAIETGAPNPIALRQQGDRLAAAIMAAGGEVDLTDLQDAVATFEGRVRLSPTFRFQAASPRLDALSRLEVEALGRRLAEGVFDGRRLTLIGFSDGAGNALDNLSLSRERAEAVRAALVAGLGHDWPAEVEIATHGLGEVIPIACDDTPWGRHANRRVELWVDALE